MPKQKLPENKMDLIKRMNVVLDELFAESDRGCVLVGASVLDETLEILLRAKFSSEPIRNKSVDSLFEPMGPLSSFWAKIHLANALELIDEWMFRDLEIIREIRNEFAHQYKKVDFEDPYIIKQTKRLAGAEFAVATIKQKNGSLRKVIKEEELTVPRIKGEQLGHPLNFKKERARFCFSVSYIAGGLQGIASRFNPKLRYD